MIGHFDSLKERMLHVYQSKGFKILSSHLKHLSKPADSDLSDLLNKLTKNQQPTAASNHLSLVYDRSKKDIGLLLRLYALQTRLTTINTFLGSWKPVTNIIINIRCIVPKVPFADRPDRVCAEAAGVVGAGSAGVHARACEAA